MNAKFLACSLLAAGLVSSLAGCSSELSTEAAGKKYLATVCPLNIAREAMTEAMAANDFPLYAKAAANSRDAAQSAAKTLSDNSTAWPSGLKPLLDGVRADTINLTAYFNLIASTTNFQAAKAVSIPSLNNGSAAQEIRVMLNLSADTKASCEAYK